MWQPSASIPTLKARSIFLAAIRQFFASKDVWEVETPILSNNTVTDLHLDAFNTQFNFDVTGEQKSLFLQTSPEFAMKRLLAADSGAIFQITKAFRHEAAGRFHNPEFTMLEWYRPDFDDKKLMAELDELLQFTINTKPAIYLSYQQAFIDYLSFDPLATNLTELKSIITKHSTDEWLQQETKTDTLLQWLFSMKIEPLLGLHSALNASENPEKKLSSDDWTPCFIYDFPASQASLAKVSQSDSRVAHRFELYYQGVELANGFYELQDNKEQLRRFNADNALRVQAGLPAKPIDNNLLAALESGLPDCAGVAVGIDRLFMLKQNLTHINQAIAFDVSRA
ncbi:elongation factor P--(R)-beta-lysine ligase [Psychrosphaera saromensis]|uniref:Elongation factor P lysine(34) lysyltransferase n=1 Tax=Psychrosphaera saromensis TaxID=716813 RepID=A0A2S7UTN3_9GAMM|nr:elongation factor P--(R)-beta-lysine ligase [Psychrosphaera saromensis]PQJ53098.1 elongation factor P lysine(34) lysyltransferase [Psychrosphaera saromensis]GHB68096.1 elongation factor P--(R)-beta-lysine ligase [Psychrosphaera saromensis]GLQ15150.1 elongation factor P--(R)-beta-lysine ligase [Psychrosphaera saromensis]